MNITQALREIPGLLIMLLAVGLAGYAGGALAVFASLALVILLLDIKQGNQRLDARLAQFFGQFFGQEFENIFGKKSTWREGAARYDALTVLLSKCKEESWKNSLPNLIETNEIIEDIVSTPREDPQEHTEEFLKELGRASLLTLQKLGRARLYAFRAECLSKKHGTSSPEAEVFYCLPDADNARLYKTLASLNLEQEDIPQPGQLLDVCGIGIVRAVHTTSYLESAGRLWRLVFWQGYDSDSPGSDGDEQWLKRFARQLTQSLFLRFRVRYLEQAHFEEQQKRERLSVDAAHRSHDLRSPLANVRSILEYLQLGFQEKTRSVHDLRSLCEAAKQDCDKISQFLQGAVSGVVSGTEQKARQEQNESFEDASPSCYPAKLFDEHLASYRMLAEEKGLLFQVETSIRAESCRLRLPERDMLSIITNMVSNAVKYTESGWIRLLLDLGPDGLECICRDSGPGIPRAILTKLRRGNRPETSLAARRFIGDPSWGEGLHGLQDKALALGAEFQISSIEGVGTELRFVFPHRFLEQATPDTASQLVQAPLDIVLVDDEVQFAYSFARLLEISGQSAHVCANFSQLQALLMKREHAPVVLLDQSLLHASGFAECERIKEMYPHLRMGVMSGSDFFWRRNRSRFDALGVEQFFLKPCGAQEIISWAKEASASGRRKQVLESLTLGRVGEGGA